MSCDIQCARIILSQGGITWVETSCRKMAFSEPRRSAARRHLKVGVEKLGIFGLFVKTPNHFIKNRHFGLVDFTCFIKTPNQRGLKLDYSGEMVGDFSKTAKTPNSREHKLVNSGKMVGCFHQNSKSTQPFYQEQAFWVGGFYMFRKNTQPKRTQTWFFRQNGWLNLHFSQKHPTISWNIFILAAIELVVFELSAKTPSYLQNGWIILKKVAFSPLKMPELVAYWR